MNIYTYTEVRERLSDLLERALREGQIKFRNRAGQVFVIRPEKPLRASPFDVPSVKATLTKQDILDAIQEGRARYSAP